MFTNINKPAFGAGTSAPSFGFGTNSTANQTPFGQPQLFGKSTASTGFGTAAPLFGSTTQPSGGGLFPSSSVSSFGATPQTGFGTSLFGQQQNAAAGNGLFANSNTAAFGQQNKTTGFGFGSTTATPLFGQQAQSFQPSTSAGVFGSAPTFGGTTQMGTVVKFNPVTGTDTMQKNGLTHSISTKHHCITCMKEYESKSLEELRWEDYQCNRRGPQQQSSFGTSPFGAPVSTAPSLFGQTDNKPAFGQTTTFGATNSFGLTNQQTPQTSLFGKPAGAFGVTPTTNTFSGFNIPSNFGANTSVKPFGTQASTSVFGAPTSQPSAFGSTLFSQTSAQNTNSFFNKPTQSAFTTQQPVFPFGQQTTNQSNLFQPSKPTTGFSSFGQTNLTSNSGFGQQPNMFSQTQQNPFNAFQKPAQPAFGQPLQSGFGLGTQAGNTSLFGANKPMFGTTTQSSFFNPPSSGFMMPQQQPIANQTLGGNETQPQQDFHAIVGNMYEPFPHRDLFDGIEIKNYSKAEATNPVVLKKIIEDPPMPGTGAADATKFRIFPKPKQSNAGKFALINIEDSVSSQNNFVLHNSSSGKRLTLRKTVPRNEKDLLEEYKSMATSSANKNKSLFKSDAFDEAHDINGSSNNSGKFQLGSPSALKAPLQLKEIKQNGCNSTGELQSPNLSEEKNMQDQSTQTPPKASPQFKKQTFPLFDSETDSGLEENGIQYDEDGKDKGSRKSVRFLDENSDSYLKNGTSSFSQSTTDTASQSENDTATTEEPQYPSGIKLTRSEYYTVPLYNELHKYQNDNGACIVKGFTVGRYGYGSVQFPDEIDISNLDLDEIVHFGFRNVTVYPDDNNKPPVGQGLNRQAKITLEHVWPRHLATHEVIKDPKEIAAVNFIDRLAVLSEKQNAELVDYHPDTGSWIFTVQHFSKFRFSDADDEAVAQELQRKRESEKQKELQKKKLEGAAGDTAKGPVKRGLGGIMFAGGDNISQQTSLHHQTLSQSRISSVFRDDVKSALVMKSSFFDEESMSDDVSSSDIGIVHHFTMPQPLAVKLHQIPQKIKIGQPKYTNLLNVNCYAPIERTLPFSRNYMDTGLFKGKSFKVGWGRGFTLLTIMSCTSESDPHIINKRHDVSYSSNGIMHLEIGSLSRKPQMMYVERHLNIIFEESDVIVDSFGVPFTKVMNLNTLLLHKQVAGRMNIDHKSRMPSYYQELWDLCLALWGPDAINATSRCELFSNWLEETTPSFIEKNRLLFARELPEITQNIFVYLVSNRVAQATQLAIEKRLPRLATLISQATAHNSAKILIQAQLKQWKVNGFIDFIERNLLKIYMLLGGIPVIGNVNLCENLDWKRALGIHFWYICPPGMSFIEAIRTYQHAFQAIGYACQPCPERYEFRNVTVHDILYQIMLLYLNTHMPIQHIIDPMTHTEDPIDYRLSWLLLQVFTSIKIGHIRREVANAVHINFSSQLEHLGMWKWAIFVLLFIDDSSARKTAIFGVLDRNLNPDRTSKDNLAIEDFLVNQLKIPSDWIHTLLAIKTGFADRQLEAYKHFILKEDWSMAHKLAVSHVIPEFISIGQCEKLDMFLKYLFPGRGYIMDWHVQAGFVMEFLDLHRMIETARYTSNINVEMLRSKVCRLCYDVKEFPVHSVKQVLAISELSRFIAIILKIVFFELQPYDDKTVERAAGFLRMLQMPPDYKHPELLRYIDLYLKVKDFSSREF